MGPVRVKVDAAAVEGGRGVDEGGRVAVAVEDATVKAGERLNVKRTEKL